MNGKMIEEMEKFIIKTRNILKNILLAGSRPVKNTSRKDCYFCLMNLQELYKSNTSISDKDFLKILFDAKIPKGSVVLSREEYEGKEIVVEMSGSHKLRLTVGKFGEMGRVIEEYTRKETAKEIINMLIPDCQYCDEDWRRGCLCLRETIAEKITNKFGVEVEE